MPIDGREKMKPIYLDNAATTPADPKVIDAIRQSLERDYGNPSSRHALGLNAEKKIRSARRSIARAVNAKAKEVVFTSGGTEALALALLGSAQNQRKPGHVLISSIEHAAVFSTAKFLDTLGHQVELLPVDGGGSVDPERVSQAMTDRTFLVAVMQVNNETGIEQPVAEIGRRVKETNPRCLFLVDAVQAFATANPSLESLRADMLCISGHKINGPKGVGALIRSESVKLNPLWGGGDQEDRLRPGTENAPGIIGFGVASELRRMETAQLRDHTNRLRDAFLNSARASYAIGNQDRRAPHIVAVAIPDIRSETLVNALSEAGVYVSSGSACHARRSLRSHVLQAMGIPESHNAIRISVNRLNTDDEIDEAVDIIRKTLRTF